MSEFYATTNPDGTIEPHWVEGQREILCSAGLIKQMIDNANRGILMELETHDAIRADREKLIGLLEGEPFLVNLSRFIAHLKSTPIGDGEK